MTPAAALDSAGDPFGERTACPLHTQAQVLGGVFEFESNDVSLLQLAESAFGGLPAHTFSSAPPRFHIKLLLSNDAAPPVSEEVPPVRLHSGGGLLCGTMDAANFAVLSPAQRTGLIVVSRNMLRHAQIVRYELIEFAVYTLTSRAQELVSLHAGCVGRNQQALLLIGEGGAGKSTLALHCLMQSMELIAEDAVFVEPETLLASGVGNFLHLRTDSLDVLRQTGDDVWIRRSPVIRRRSGVEKFEIDVRRTRYRLAQTPLELAGVVFLSSQHAPARDSLLARVSESEFQGRLAACQPYAASRPGWAGFLKRISPLPAFEMRRARDPMEAVHALRQIIE